MKALIVHAHHEPQSFSSALARQASESLERQGYTVEIADLYKEQFNPVSNRDNFTSIKNLDYLKQQGEEAYASEVGGFSPALEQEIQRLESCDLLIFNFPLWWFGMPAILKGWVDRVFVSGRIYGGDQIYETGVGKSKKKAFVMLTTGGGPDVYSGYGVNPSLATVLTPIHHGVFWFNGFLPLDPFVAWSPARITLEERTEYLATLDQRLQTIGEESAIVIPPLKDFPGWGKDAKKRFMVTVTRNRPADEAYRSLIPAEGEQLAKLKKAGVLLSSHIGKLQVEPWKAFLQFRETDVEAVQRHLQTLPLASYLNFEISELEAL